MHSGPIRFHVGLLAVLLLLSVSCGGALSKAIDRGDKFAEAGQWEEAASAYKEALKIDPNSAEAKIKLQKVRERQADERLERARSLEERGELASAYNLVLEAVELDPERAATQKALTRLSNKILDKVDGLVSNGKLLAAFELTTLVLKGSANHPRARALDGQLRDALAQETFEKGQAFAERGRLGNALVQFATCLGYRPDFPDARLLFGQAKLRLQESLRFWVVLDKLTSDGQSKAVLRSIDPSLLQQAFDERLLVKITNSRPPAVEDMHGVVVSGLFEGYNYQKNQRTSERSCDYVCGTDYKPNPDLQQLRGELANLDSRMSQHDQRISDFERRLAESEKKLSREEQERDEKRSDLDEARGRLSDCRERNAENTTSSNPCSSEESNVRSKESYLESAQRDVDSARREVEGDRDDAQREKKDRESVRQQREDTNQKLLNTPEQIAVDRYCPFTYPVQLHQAATAIALRLSISRIEDDSALLRDEKFDFNNNAQDQTHGAHPGRCTEVASSDPFELPSEGELVKDLANQVIKDLRSKILSSYDAYRSGFLAAARRSETSGLAEEATESYVRYILTGPKQAKGKKEIQAFLRKSAGLTQIEGLWKL